MRNSTTQRGIFFGFFVVVAALTSVIGGLTAAMLDASGMEIISTAAITFATALTLSMSAYLFLETRSKDD